MIFCYCYFFFFGGGGGGLFSKIILGIASYCPAGWIHILSYLIWIQNVCKSYQQTTLVGKHLRSPHILGVNIYLPYMVLDLRLFYDLVGWISVILWLYPAILSAAVNSIAPRRKEIALAWVKVQNFQILNF